MWTCFVLFAARSYKRLDNRISWLSHHITVTSQLLLLLVLAKDSASTLLSGSDYLNFAAKDINIREGRNDRKRDDDEPNAEGHETPACSLSRPSTRRVIHRVTQRVSCERLARDDAEVKSRDGDG